MGMTRLGRQQHRWPLPMAMLAGSLTGQIAAWPAWATVSQASASWTVHGPVGERQTSVEKLLRMSDADAALVELFRRGVDIEQDLVRSLAMPEVRRRAGQALAYIGDPQGLKALLSTIAVERDAALEVELSGYLAGALVRSTGADDTAFLEHCLRRYRQTDAEGPAASAALALGSARTPEALRILRIAEPVDEEALPEHEIAKARRWITTTRVVSHRRSGRPVSDDDRVKRLVLDNAFYAEGEEGSLAVNAVLWSARRDKALVEVTVGQATAQKEYRVTVQRVPGRRAEFRIAGIWLNLVA